MNTSPRLQLFKDTLLLIPCSKTKQHRSKPSNAASILSALDPARAAALANARAKLSEKIKEEKKPKEAPVDEKTLMPAYLRYSGQLYKHCSADIGAALAVGRRVLIVSGGYGLLLADEPIGMYEKRFTLSDWPGGLLEGCILDYARHEGIQSIIAVMARTSTYATLIRRWKRKGAGLPVTLVSPDFRGPNVGQKKVLKAQGEAITALINNGLDKDWRSSDGLSLEF